MKDSKWKDRLEVATHSILETWSSFEISVKSVRDVENALDVLHAQRLFVIDSEGLSGANCVFDLLNNISICYFRLGIAETYLSAIEVVSSKSIVILLLERHRIDTLQNPHTLNEHLKHALLSLDAELAVAESDVDS